MLEYTMYSMAREERRKSAKRVDLVPTTECGQDNRSRPMSSLRKEKRTGFSFLDLSSLK